jgi:hypothetical protein
MGNEMAKNAQISTTESVQAMDLFRSAMENRQNVDFVFVKGNLFEYIEAAKFNQNAAAGGSELRAVVTDAAGRPHDAADIEIVQSGKVVQQVQAKFSDAEHAASASVNMQRDDKYAGMQRLIRKEDNYTTPKGENTTLLDESKRLAKARADKQGTIYQEQYEDVYENLTDELHHGDVSSGGTTLDEVKAAYRNPEKYSKSFERKQMKAEMKVTAASMAKASFVTTGIISGISNMFQVFRNEKDLGDALRDVGADAVKSGVRGGATGVISTAIRYKGIKAGSALLSDSIAATVMAGGIIDGGVALYSYARGEITAEQLRDQLVDTTAKAATTIYFTKAVGAIMGSALNPIFPMVVYTTASYVFACTREIINNAKLNAAEYERMASILQESGRAIDEYHEQFKQRVDECEGRQREMLEGFVNTFDYNMTTGENYDEAIYAIVNFANRAGIALQHIEFQDFAEAMKSDEPLKLS